MFASRIARSAAFRNVCEPSGFEAQFLREFKERTGWDYPDSEAEWRAMLAAAGFTLQQEIEIRTKTPDESEIREYFCSPGSLLATLYARLPRKGAAGEAEKPSGQQPSWNNATGELRFGGDVVRIVARRAITLRPILDAFEAAGWPALTPDPLKGRWKDAERIHRVCRKLNQGLTGIRFAAGGDGETYAWKKGTEK